MPDEESVEEITDKFVRRNLRVIPDLPAESTSDRVYKLFSTDDGRGLRKRRSTLLDYNFKEEESIGYNETIFIE